MVAFLDRIFSSLESAMGAGYPVLFNAVGVIAIFLQIMIFQMKERKHIIFVSILNNIGWLSYFFLRGNYVGGVGNIVGIMSNVVFSMRGKYRWANSKAWLFLFLAIAGTLAAVMISSWKDIFPMIGSLSSTYAFFMIKENNIRKVSLFTYCMYICNNILYGNTVALIADVTALASVVVSLIRYGKKEKAAPTEKPEMQPEPQSQE